MRLPLIVGNWKMYNTKVMAVNLVEGILQKIAQPHDREIVVCPPFTALDSVFRVIKDTCIKLGAQDIYWENEGAYTGEISPAMLVDAGCAYVIIGHSERRKYFYEVDKTVNNKIKAALLHNLMPIVCVGESLEIREKGETKSFVVSQIKEGLANITSSEALKIVIAYEPIWAIGTGKNDSPQSANDTILEIRNALTDLWGYEVSQKIRILYGGSVKPENIDGFMREKEIDGALVGGASLKVDSFTRIINFE